GHSSAHESKMTKNNPVNTPEKFAEDASRNGLYYATEKHAGAPSILIPERSGPMYGQNRFLLVGALMRAEASPRPTGSSGGLVQTVRLLLWWSTNEGEI